MTRFVETFRIPAPAAEVWPLVNWFGPRFLSGHIYVTRALFNSTEPLIGSLRIFEVEGRPNIVERLVSYSEQDRTYDYRVIDAGDWPFADYVGTVSVLQSGADACYLAFACDCIPVGISVKKLGEMYGQAEKALADAVMQVLKLK